MNTQTSRTAGTESPAHEEGRTPGGLLGSPSRRAAGLLIVAIALAATILLSLAVGANPLSLDAVGAGFRHPDDSEASIIVWTLRVPRTVIGVMAGVAFGVAGALIQAITRNPLADPGILGVNAGATFGVAAATGLLGLTAPLAYVWFALAGAAAITIVVYVLGSLGGSGATPVKLTMAGVALSAVLGGMTSAIILSNRATFDDMRFWGVGAIGGRSLDVVLSFAPLIVVGLALAVYVARPLNALALGDDLGISLGVKTRRTRVIVVVAVTLLAGTATALAGPIGFIGLMVPHAVRWFVGPDQRWIIAFTIVLSPILLLVADIVGRIILPSGELRVGLVTGIIGAPVLILLARRRSVSAL
jgi:iron complex transport system permease protein